VEGKFRRFLTLKDRLTPTIEMRHHIGPDPRGQVTPDAVGVSARIRGVRGGLRAATLNQLTPLWVLAQDQAAAKEPGSK
jgi:hypothetical protein